MSVARRYVNVFCLIFIISSVGVRCTMAADQLPIGSVDIVLEKDTLNQFFDELRRFADYYQFAIRIDQSGPTNEDFLVQMWRSDVKIIATNGDPENPSAFALAFYKNNDENLPEWVVTDMVAKLKSYVANIKGVVFREEGNP